MARSRNGEKKETIIEAAIKIFGEQGFSSTTVKDIAGEAGIAPGSVYTYFHDKTDLFRSTVEYGWKQLLAEIKKLKEHPLNFQLYFSSLIDRAVDLLKQALPLLRGMLFDANKMDLLQTYLENAYTAIDDFIVKAQKEGVLHINKDKQKRITAIRVVFLGSLLSAALADPGSLKQELDSLKMNLKDLVMANLRSKS